MEKRQEPLRIEDFTFIGSGRSEPSEDDPISENHDEALAKDFFEEMMEKRQEWEDWERKKQNRRNEKDKD